MHRIGTLSAGILLVCTLALPGAARAASALPRYPTLHGDAIVFEAGGNLWTVAREGGTARRLTTDPGYDLLPRFSPDGKWIAFTGEYDGNRDVYVMPAGGGTPQRLTFHSDVVEHAPLRWGPDNMVVTWTPDGKDVVFLSRRDAYNSWFGRLFAVPREGGLPVALPLPKGGMTSYSPDGKRIAYNRIFRNFRTWKRYQGGLAQDVWIYDLGTRRVKRVTDWKGTDTDPMWYGDTIYFSSDRGPRFRKNLWAYDLKTEQFRQVTHFEDYDVDWPSLGNDGIVLQCGGALYVLDLPSETLHRIDVEVPGDAVRERPRWADASKSIRAFDVAPNGKRALFGARGEILTVPREHGNTRDLTGTAAAREQYPAWSPDGKRVAYTTDRTGESQIAVRPADGSGEESVLTSRGAGYLYGPVWSPDGKKLAYSDSEHVLWYLDVDSKKAVQVDRDPRSEIRDYAWSPDALWLAYSKSGDNDLGNVYLFGLASGKATRVSRGTTDDREPVFGPDGKYLFFRSGRHENPVFSQSELNVATLKTYGIYVATLRAGEPSPFEPRSDEGAPAPGEDGKDAKEPEAWKPGAIAAIRIDLDGLADRVVPVPVPAGNIAGLAVRPDHLYYMTMPDRSFETPLPGETSQLHCFRLKERKDAVLASPLDAYAVSADGSTILYRNEKEYVLTDARPKGEAAMPPEGGAEPKTLDLSGMQVRVDPAAEWREMFHEAWRLERDFFYSTEMNGVDWAAVRGKYETLLPAVASREDLNYVLGEMLGELGNSHTYVGGGDEATEPKPVPTGLLGVDFGLDAKSGRYYFATIYPGDNSREAMRSPLTGPGVNVHEGDFLLAVDGHDLEAPENPYRPFVNTLRGTVTLTVASDARGKDRRDVTVKPIADELQLRLEAWIEHNRKVADEASGGKIGYLYLSDMDEQGLDEFIRQFYWQTRKEGLIVDVRYNGGGFIDQIALERLRRVLVGMAVNRQRQPFTIPSELQVGYKVCLANHYSASDGDIFPYYFKAYGLGPVIGTRTWGGVRGIRGYWPLMDGGYVTIPEDSLYGLDSQWVIENHGVDPDVEVDDLPGDVMAGKDAQLQAAIDHLMDKIRTEPKELPPPPPLLPAYPPEAGGK